MYNNEQFFVKNIYKKTTYMLPSSARNQVSATNGRPIYVKLGKLQFVYITEKCKNVPE